MKILALILSLTVGGALAADMPVHVDAGSGHSTIACRVSSSYVNRCESFHTARGYEHLTPAQFAKQAGFNFIHKQSVVLVGTYHYIIMEVSK